MQKPMTRRTTKRSTLRVQSDLAKPLQTAFCRASRSDLFWNNYSFWKQCSKKQCLEPLFFWRHFIRAFCGISKPFSKLDSQRQVSGTAVPFSGRIRPSLHPKTGHLVLGFCARIFFRDFCPTIWTYTDKDVAIEIWSNKGLTMKNGGLTFKMERVN